MKIERDFKNDLLKRRELEVLMDADSNPGFEGAKSMLAGELKVSEDVIVVRGVKGHFGSNEFLVDAFIYDSVEDKEKTEPKPKVKKEVKK